MPSASLLFRLVVRAYPRAFRERYGEELSAAFDAACGGLRRDATETPNRAERRRRVTAALVDLLRTGLAERLAARGYRRGRTRLRVPATGPAALARDLAYDLRHALRDLLRTPDLLALLVLTAGLGIGANIVIFSAAWGTLARPLPFEHAPDLVRVAQSRPDFGDDDAGARDLPFSVAELEDYAAAPSLAEVAEYHGMTFTLVAPDGATRVSAGVVSANYFAFVGMEPALGRLFTPGEDELGTDPVIVLSHDFWEEAFGADPAAVGSWIEMNGEAHQVVGVLPPIPQFPRENDVYLPISVCPTRSSPSFIEDRQRRMMTAYARLGAGWTLGEARADLARLGAELRAAHPDAYDLAGGYAVEITPMGEDLSRAARPVLGTLIGIALLLLVITWANAASVLLSRAARRWECSAIRSALGAGRGRLLRQHLTEGLILAAAGLVLGWVIALLTHDTVAGFAAGFTTRARQIRLDGDVLIFALLTGLLTALVFGLAPLAAAARSPVLPSLSGGSATPGRRVRAWQRRLVVLQVAVAFVALSGSGLLLRSLVVADHLDLGLSTESVLTARIGLDGSRYPDRASADAFMTRVTDAIRHHPSARGVARLPWAPIAEHHEHRNAFFLRARPDADPVAAVGDLRVVDPEAFDVLGMVAVDGRLLSEADRADTPRVAVVNEMFRRVHMDGGIEIGATATQCQPDGRCLEPYRIVGVVSDIRSNGSEAAVIPEIYVPRAQSDWFLEVVAIRVIGDVGPVLDEMRATVARLDPGVPVTDVGTLEDFRRERLAPRRFLTLMAGLGALVATVLALAGVFGIAHLTASARMREMGLRQALGAGPTSIVGLVLSEGLRVVGTGLVLGGLFAWHANRALASLLWAVEPHDPLTLAVATGLFLATAAIAVLLPARRVARQDVMNTLSSL